MNQPETITQTCANHPTRETLIRCNHCDKPICLDCAVSTPTGYRCKECIRAQQKKFDTALPVDYLTASVIALVLGALGSFLLYRIPSFQMLLSLLLGVGMGNAIVTLVRKAGKRRRSSQLTKFTVYAAGVGGIIPLMNYIFRLFRMVFLGQYGMLISYSIFVGWGILYIAVLCSTILTNMKGFSLRRR